MINSDSVKIKAGLMPPKSIRWRLPLSYATIALLATLALGAVLITTLRGYYAQREHDNLLNNAQMVSDVVGSMYDRERPQDLINSQINTFSFVSQARIKLFDPNESLLTDSGDPWAKRVITLSYSGAPPNTSAFYFGSDSDPAFVPGIAAERFWIAGGSTEETMPAQDAQPDQFAMAVSASPYGIGLRRDFVANLHSDQVVRVAVRDKMGGVLGVLEVSNGPAYGMEIIAGLSQALIGAGAVAVILAAGAGWFMSRTITAPLLLLTNATAKMTEGQLSTRVNLKRTDEFGALAQSFDEMAQRVEATVTALRRFVADAAHQIHTPLTAVHADLELASSEPDAERQQLFIERAQAQLKRLEALTNDLLDLSRLEAHVTDERRTVVDLALLVREISEAFASRADQAGIAFNVEVPDAEVKARVNETQFRHAICNLLDNAIKFTPENGTITLGVRRDGEQVELWVNDTGIGIAAEDLPNLFNRFHRGRNAAAYPGSGLGLAIIKAIVDGHQGEIRVRSHAGDGTQFALRVPAGAS